ncbi:hypothetical protein [Caballeronia sp. KNU42]
MTDYLDALLHGKNRAKTATGDAANRYRCYIARSFRPRFSLNRAEAPLWISVMKSGFEFQL